MAPASCQQLHCQFLQKKRHVSRRSFVKDLPRDIWAEERANICSP